MKNISEVLVNTTFYTELTKNIKIIPRYFAIEIFNGSYGVRKKKKFYLFTQFSFLEKLKKKLELDCPNIVKESSFKFELILKLQGPVYLNGFFQSYKYLLGKESLIQGIYTFPLEDLDTANEETKRKIIGKTSVSVYISGGVIMLKTIKHKNFMGTVLWVIIVVL